jgi:tRNA (guanine37-N1)-methyltransferase
MLIIESVSRLVPGVLGNPDSPETESFAANLLEYPQYTRPRNYKGMEVPEELLSGNHSRIQAWRETRALERTRQRRPDLTTRSIE